MSEALIRVLIVDDEPPARARIRALVGKDPDFDIVGECGDGKSAVQAIRELGPDLVFLDIQMPGASGLEVVQGMPKGSGPLFIFVTAFDQHALRAFELRVLDYLLKPFDRRRFSAALDRARQHVAQRRKTQPAPETGPRLDRLPVKVDGRITLIRLDSIVWFESVGKYVNIHTAGETFLHRETLRSLESRLDTLRFLRIHRSAIVNVACVTDLEPAFHGDYVVRLQTGLQLPLGRKYRDRVRKKLGLARPAD